MKEDEIFISVWVTVFLLLRIALVLAVIGGLLFYLFGIARDAWRHYQERRRGPV